MEKQGIKHISELELSTKQRFAIVIGVVGRLCAGKRGIRIVKGGDIPVEYLLRLLIKLRQQGKTLQEQKLELEKEIMQIYKQLVVEFEDRCKQILDEWTIPTVIDRIYTQEEIQFMSKRNYFHQVFVDCPLLTRFQNFQFKYSAFASDINLEVFCLLDDCINYGIHLHQIIKHVKLNILNDGTIQKLDQEINVNNKKIFRAYKPDWDMYFMKLAVEVKKRSNCSKRSVGAILVSKDNRILSTGYNGTPYHLKDCFNDGCKRCNSNIGQGKNLMDCRCIHAEDNCILDVGVRVCKEIGGTLYTTLFPCKWCAKVMIQSGIQRLVFMEDFDGNKSMEIMDEFSEQNPGKSFIIKKQTLDDYVY